MLKEVTELLNEIGRRLSEEDKQEAAWQLRVEENIIRDVLNGLIKEEWILSYLYSRACGNRTLRLDFYSPDGAERLLKRLRETKNINEI
jgi:hypothetical protein